MDNSLMFLIPVIVFILALVSGFWLSVSGKPLNPIIFNVHKLIALGAVIAFGVQLYRKFMPGELNPLIIAMLVLAGMCVVVLFATGAMMSIGNPRYDLILLVHRIALVIAIGIVALEMYVLIALE